MRNHPTLKSYKHHNGIDLQAHYEEVMAMFDGVVVRTGEDNVPESLSQCVMETTLFLIVICQKYG